MVFCHPSSLRHRWLGPVPRCQVARILSIFCELHFGARLVISKISVTKLRLVKCDTSRLKIHDSLSAENNATRKTLIWKCHSYPDKSRVSVPTHQCSCYHHHSAPAFIRHRAALHCSHDVIVRANKIITSVCVCVLPGPGAGGWSSLRSGPGLLRGPGASPG